jgi:hypothetical protein
MATNKSWDIKLAYKAIYNVQTLFSLKELMLLLNPIVVIATKMHETIIWISMASLVSCARFPSIPGQSLSIVN